MDHGTTVVLLATFAAIIFCGNRLYSDYSSRKAEEKLRRRREKAGPTPTSVNYHFTRVCNYKCGFCFHTAKTSHVLSLGEAKRGLRLLYDAGMEKINFSGGEPFMKPKFLGEIVRFCALLNETSNADDTGPSPRKNRRLSVSIVSNGSKIKEEWFKDFGQYLDILAVSCDSFNESVNKKIGRGQPSSDHLACLRNVKQWCDRYNVVFKLNTVVNTYNVSEDMSAMVQELQPARWKVFQCLLIGGENAGPEDLRNARSFVVSDEEFGAFVERHKHLPYLVPESNEQMRNSYYILDEYMRFLDCRQGKKTPSTSILDTEAGGLKTAIAHSGFDARMFGDRGGFYQWSKAEKNCGGAAAGSGGGGGAGGVGGGVMGGYGVIGKMML